MLDKSKISERRRRIIGVGLIMLGVVLGIAALVSRTAFWLAFFSLLVAWLGAAYAGRGRPPD